MKVNDVIKVTVLHFLNITVYFTLMSWCFVYEQCWNIVMSRIEKWIIIHMFVIIASLTVKILNNIKNIDLKLNCIFLSHMLKSSLREC